MPQIVVRYFAAARAASGVTEESFEASSLEELLALVTQRHGARLAAIVKVSTLLLNGSRVSDRSAPLPDGIGALELEVLPPFAGG